MKRRTIFKYVFRVLPGILFLISATAKLIGIDAFELYLFSFGWFSLGTSYLLARLLIAAEYTLGILLIANFHPRLAFGGSVALLAVFSLFLAGLLIAGRQDNCHCFGEWVDLNPTQSLLKNAGMLALLLLGAGMQPFRAKRKGLWLAAALVVPLAAVLIVSPPDNWRYDSYARHELVNEAALQEALETNLLPASVAEGERVVCFYSLKCPYCKMSAQKLASLRARGEFADAPVIVIFGRGADTGTTDFFAETGLKPDEIHFIEPADFLRITNGAFPVILVMDHGAVLEKYNYRNLHGRRNISTTAASL